MAPPGEDPFSTRAPVSLDPPTRGGVLYTVRTPDASDISPAIGTFSYTHVAIRDVPSARGSADGRHVPRIAASCGATGLAKRRLPT